MPKAPRNQTIDFSLESAEAQQYLARCIPQAALAADPAACTSDSIIVGDTLSALPQLAPGCADLLIADPPYNLTKQYHGNGFHAQPAEEYAAYTARWLTAALPLLKPNASVYVCCDWRSSLLIAPVLAQHLTVQNRITWQREKGRGAARNWKNAMEDIWFATVSQQYTFNLDAVRQRRRVLAPYRAEGAPKDWQDTPDGKFRDTCPSNFWDDISVPYWSMPENTAHPTQKPEKLLAKLILASSNPGDLVLDPFLGSGSTAVAAKKLGRHYLGIEQNPLYCAWAQKRLALAEADASIQGYADGVFWERNSAPVRRKGTGDGGKAK